jgi:hypothetical protein
VGTTAVGGKAMTTSGLENPVLNAAAALFTSAVFWICLRVIG